MQKLHYTIIFASLSSVLLFSNTAMSEDSSAPTASRVTIPGYTFPGGPATPEEGKPAPVQAAPPAPAVPGQNKPLNMPKPKSDADQTAPPANPEAPADHPSATAAQPEQPTAPTQEGSQTNTAKNPPPPPLPEKNHTQ